MVKLPPAIDAVDSETVKRYVVMHDYGHVEGWKIQAECDTLLEAAEAREADIANAGGTSEIFEHIDVFAAYRSADYQREKQKRKAAQAQ